MKKITFFAEESMIKKAQEKAHREKSTLNIKFIEWLEQYISQDTTNVDQIDQTISKVSYAKSRKSYSREELNQR